MKFPKISLPSFVKHTWVLYLVSALAFLNILGLIRHGYLEHVLFFVLLSLLVFQYTPNMVLVLGIPLLLINLYLYVYRTFEGLKTRNILKNKKKQLKKNQTILNR